MAVSPGTDRTSIGLRVALTAATVCANEVAGAMIGPVRVTIRVRPGAGRTAVGGELDGALVVRVSARAVDGQATEAALAAVARAFGVRRRAVTLVTGAASRTKVVDVAGGHLGVLAELLGPNLPP
jgi:uncharacterized protein YggU (UPF0235/DUF167 family)